MENIVFSSFNDNSIDNFCNALYYRLSYMEPIFVCIGSDLVLGDSLGPLVGTLLKEENLNAYVYGTLNYPITAKEIVYAKKLIKVMHPNSVIVSIDASIGSDDEIGCIKLCDGGIRPGLGVNKNIEPIGDVGILGIVAGRSKDNLNLFNYTHFNMVYKEAVIISSAIKKYLLMNNRRYIYKKAQ